MVFVTGPGRRDVGVVGTRARGVLARHRRSAAECLQLPLGCAGRGPRPARALVRMWIRVWSRRHVHDASMASTPTRRARRSGPGARSRARAVTAPSSATRRLDASNLPLASISFCARWNTVAVTIHCEVRGGREKGVAVSGSRDVGTSRSRRNCAPCGRRRRWPARRGWDLAREVAPTSTPCSREARTPARPSFGRGEGDHRSIAQYEIRSGALTHVGKRHLARAARGLPPIPARDPVIERCSISYGE